MFKKLFSSTQQTETKKTGVRLCSININLNTDNTMTTELFWPDLDTFTDEQIYYISIEYSAILYDIMNGHIKNNIIDALYSASKHPQDQKFVSYILNNLLSYNKMISSEIDELVVHPTNVFKK